MFAENLRKAMDDARMSAAELARATGIGNSAISQYLSGKNVPRNNKIAKLAAALGVSESFLVPADKKEEDAESPYKMTVKKAAKLMGVSEQFIRIGLQREFLPFGFAMQTQAGGKRFEYYISPRQFSDYTGIPIDFLKEGAKENGEAENIL